MRATISRVSIGAIVCSLLAFGAWAAAAKSPLDEVRAKAQVAVKLSKPEARLWKNTLFALHGRIFKDPDLDKHFRAQAWYKPDPGFDDSMLSPEEWDLAAELDRSPYRKLGHRIRLHETHLGEYWSNDRSHVGVLWRAVEDLDGDGKPDTISLESRTSKGNGSVDNVLSVNGASFPFETKVCPLWFWVTDIDSTDKFHEIVIGDPGPSDDYSAHLFRYDHGHIELIADEVPGTDTDCDGTGIVTAHCRGKVLHTWSYPGRYALDKAGKLAFVPREYYPMSTNVTVTADVLLFAKPGAQARTVQVHKGTRAVIVQTDNASWCQLCMENGACGWFHLNGYASIDGKDAYEYFSGLSSAD